MTRIERLIVLTTFIGQLLFVPAGLWALGQPGIREHMHVWTTPIAWVLVPLSLVATVLLYRDIFIRPLKHKAGWILAIFFTGGAAIIPYAFIHAFQPRPTHAQI